MNKYNELKNFIDNFVEKNIHHFIDGNDKNAKAATGLCEGFTLLLGPGEFG